MSDPFLMNEHKQHGDTRLCANCGKTLEGRRSDAKFCGSSCRARASEHAESGSLKQALRGARAALRRAIQGPFRNFKRP